MLPPMTPNLIARYLNPWKFHAQEKQRRLDALRRRDGDGCRRCRRPLRFDLPEGHDQAATVEPIRPVAPAKDDVLDNLCLCHVRCNASMVDHTLDVKDRIRRRQEAALFKPRRKRAAAG
jgi:hypothetical protein